MLDLPIEDLLSAGVILIAVIINAAIFIKSYKSWRENQLTQTLLFALTAIFMAIAMLLLVAERLFLTLGDNDLGMLFGLIAITVSGFAVVSIDSFSFNIVFPKKYKVLTVFSACIEALYLGFWYFDPARRVESGEIILSDLTELLPFFTLVPLLVIPVIVFFYYAIKVRNESPVSSKRSWVLGGGVAIISAGFIIEIVGLDPTTQPWAPPVIVFGRTLFIIGALLLYWGLFRLKSKE